MIFAIVCARTAAMAFNRLVDANIDRKNPRTAEREIPRGTVSARQALLLTVGASSLFIFSAALLGFHCLVLSPLVLFVLLGYSFTKRFTPYSHLVLGLALALAPGGAWWVVRPEIHPVPLLLMAGVILWVGGFDILYSCQDTLFDRAHGIFSIPAQFGTERALQISFALHCLASACFIAVGLVAGLSQIYFLGMLVIVAILLYQHRLVNPVDFSRINRTFFTFNGIVSIAYLAVTLLAI